MASEPTYEICIPSLTGGAEHRLLVATPGAQQFADRLRKAAKERAKWSRREAVNCYRVYDSDLPDYCAAIDLYTGLHCNRPCSALYISEYAAPKSIDAHSAAQRFADIALIAPVVLGIPSSRVFVKRRAHSKGGSQYLGEGGRPWGLEVKEAGLTFETDLGAYLDTGLFLDHRITRALLRERASGTRFLNLFAYTGSATVYAAAGGAATTTTVDLSQTYLDWAFRNMRLNGFMGKEHSYVRADVLRWVSDMVHARQHFDLIFVDPPTFSNSKSMGKRTWDVQRDHVELLTHVSHLLSDTGMAIFSCNLRSFKPDFTQLEDRGVRMLDISEATIPYDFKRNTKIHKCYELTRLHKGS